MTNSDPAVTWLNELHFMERPAIKKVAILGASDRSNYFLLDGLDIYTRARDLRTYNGSLPVVTHAPCAQWSRLHKFANDDKEEKELAWYCLETVKRVGGIFEHPEGSHFFREAGITPTICVDLHYWGFPARKPTWLFFHQCKPLQLPMNMDAITRKISHMSKGQRVETPLAMCEWLVASALNVR